MGLLALRSGLPILFDAVAVHSQQRNEIRKTDNGKRKTHESLTRIASNSRAARESRKLTMANRAFAATKSISADQIERRCYVVDAEDLVLGRLAPRVATVLRGKHKPTFTPHADTGDHVIVVNAEKVTLTRRKRQQKTYYRHSGYVGSIKSITAEKLLASAHSDRVVRSAVRGMLPRNALGRQMLSKLRVYAGPNHPHASQKPEELPLA